MTSWFTVFFNFENHGALLATFRTCCILEHRQRVFENRVLWRILGPKRDEVKEKWRRLHNEELYALCSSPDKLIIRMVKSRRPRWSGLVLCMGERRGACRILVGKPEKRRPLGRPRCRWEDIIKMDLRQVGWKAWTVSI